MTSANLDPMEDNTKRLAQALTTARSRAQSSDGLLVIEACADGQLAIRIDDRALRYGGAAVAGELTRLAAQALTAARAEVQEAAAAFAADPRIASTVAATEDAMNQPMGVGVAAVRPNHGAEPTDGLPSARYHPDRQKQSRASSWQPPVRPTPALPGAIPFDLYDDAPFDDDDDDPHYQPKSWLV